MRAQIVAVVVLPVELALSSEFHVDGFQHQFGVGAPMHDEQYPGEAAFGEGALDVILGRNVDVIQLRLPDVVDAQLFVLGLHSAVVGGRWARTASAQILQQQRNI